jgi:hypothetical protein
LDTCVKDKKLIVCNNTPAEFCSSIIKVGWVERSETRHDGGCDFVLPYESKGEFQTMNLKQLPCWLRDHYLAVGLLMLSGLSQSLFLDVQVFVFRPLKATD